MCGIAGIYNVINKRPIDLSLLKLMADILSHRGPDDNGFYVNDCIGLAHTRLSIIDLKGGSQPIFNEDKSLCVVFNGEIYNYIELTAILKKKGHVFCTHSDTEVIVHMYEEYGKNCFMHFNGQFSIALWEEKNKELIIARDRVGVRPLFYSIMQDGTVIFGSEMKSIFCHPGIRPEIDPAGINQIFTLWVNVPPRTVFKGINELAPGSYLSISPKGVTVNKFWKMQFPDEHDYEDKPGTYYAERLRGILYDAVTIRLRADVPVAAYLSGGLDSSIITSLVKRHHINNLITFSVAFSDPNFDERKYQQEMINILQTDHRVIEATYDAIGDAFSDVVWFAEKPMIRTAPAPLFLLSGLVRNNNIKVVLTGEGADEFFGGYDIFKEDKIRRFWAKFPESNIRPKLFNALYPFMTRDPRTELFWQMFFRKGLMDIGNNYYSQLVRWHNTSHIKRFFNNEYREQFSDDQIFHELEDYVDPDIQRWHPLCRAQYLEARLFMSGYLLSSQGDRMMMGNSIEGRFPFLDHNVIEFANQIPPVYKIYGLNEKYVLKKAFGDILPVSVVHRAKQPYRAPISQCFAKNNFASSMLNNDVIKRYGYFDPESVEQLLNKFKAQNWKNISERDDMSLVGIISMQLLHYHFIEILNKNTAKY
ncbi:MAG: asparagine synthase (glutamine-hydrolyzing) [Ignavibacteria bacterium RBG_13_36_8]|nr:MAG: asparagine synthase (glutamine-hydrolyzing) [Ignavibacteria bacterium RBG_13_36_8]